MKKLYVVVLYKQKALNSSTLYSFMNLRLGKNPNNFFIIWDNSPYPVTCVSELINLIGTEHIEYIHTPENISLAKIYNNCLDRYSDFDFLLIFDQDSMIIRNDFDLYLEKTINENPDINIFLPPIYLNEKLYSPGRFLVFKGWHYKDLEYGIHKDKLYTAIMSGTCVKISFLHEFNIRFNENLRLYGIDTCFFSEVRKIDKCFYLCDVTFEHNLSESNLHGTALQRQTQLYLEGMFVMHAKSKIKKTILYLYKIYLKIRGKI